MKVESFGFSGYLKEDHHSWIKTFRGKITAELECDEIFLANISEFKFGEYRNG